MLSYDLSQLWNLDARVILFPVRHHSPAAARLVRELIERLHPDAVLIEGPSDFNGRLHELWLPHRLPVAIYSFLRSADGQASRSAFYPFCEHSPEWQALQAAHEIGSDVSFIDLPWADLVDEDEEPSNRYADSDLAHNRYIPLLCERLGVEDFHTLWDTLFELDAGLPVETYLRRCHELC